MIKINGKPVQTNRLTVPINFVVNSQIATDDSIYKPLDIGTYTFKVDSNGCVRICEDDQEIEEIEFAHYLRRKFLNHALSYIYDEKFGE